jgi:hypothetical protein
MRKLRILGLIVVAIGVINAAAAAPAFAGYHIAVPAGGWIEGSQQTTNQFTFDVGTAKCTGARLSGNLVGETSSYMTLHPEYTGCTLSGQKVTINSTSCNYEFWPPSTSPLSAPIVVNCSFGTLLIKDTAGLGCEVKVGSQLLPFSPAGFANESGKVLVTYSVTGMSYSWTAGCPGAGGKAGKDTNGKYTGTVLLASSSGAAISVT